jgi:N-acylglucosamine-6-phosphate 2-epimerase
VKGTLEALRGGLIVSVQASAGSAIDDPYVLAAIAAAAEANGAVGLRVQGSENIRAARSRVAVPLIGIIKRRYDGYEPYITPTVEDALAAAEAGADIIAFDGTDRARPANVAVERIIEAIHRAGCLAMADCASASDGVRARDAGAEIVATTLCGYTEETRGTSLPALALVRELANTTGARAFVICEGGVHHPAQVEEAFAAGAGAVVVGTAITNVDWLVGEFAARTAKKSAPLH